jgi:hypothetical protein
MYHHEPFIERAAPVIFLIIIIVIFFALKKAFQLYVRSKRRVAIRRTVIVASVIWLLIASNIVRLWRYGFREHFGDFLMVGILPVIIIWGGIWIAEAMDKTPTK